MKHSIRYQLLTPLLLALVAAVLGVAGFSAWVNLSRRVAQLKERQDDVVGVLEHATFPLTDPILEQMARLSGQQFLVWHPEREQIVASSLARVPGDVERMLAASAEPPEALAFGGDRYAVRTARLRSQPQQRMFVLTSQRSLAEARWEAIWPPFAVGGGTLVLLVPWLLLLTHGWSQRLQGIQQSVARIAAGDLKAIPVADRRDDELSALVADIHRMSERLQQLQQELIQTERERMVAQLAAGFAHQFRNGVAGAAMALQLHAGRCSSANDQSLSVARKQLELLETEIRGLLSLARRTESPRQSLEMPELVGEAVALVAPAAEHRGIALANESPHYGPFLEGSHDGVRSALVNLLLNAIDAAGPSGQVRVRAVPDAAGWTVSIEDNGPGPAAAVAARMTEAFVTTKPEGIGLGLTVVAAVAHDHGGRLSWRRDGGWTVVELWLPFHRASTASAE